jgi:hypothetical protein
MDLTLLAAGSRQNFVAENAGGELSAERGWQQVTQLIATSSRSTAVQQGHDRGVRGDHERFDARQGRSTGIQVNAITKSGTNTPVRDRSPATSALTHSTPPISFQIDPATGKHKVLPYSDQH